MKPQQALATVAMAVAVLVGAGVAAHAQEPAKDYRPRPHAGVPFPPAAAMTPWRASWPTGSAPGLGKTVVVENRGAGAASSATRSVIKAAPDGYR